MAQRPTPRLESTGAGRDPTATPPFGISRSPSQRLELVFALRNGGMITAAHDMGAPVTAETLDRFCSELRQAIGAGSDWREFEDSWGVTGQRTHVQLGEVIGFTARPAR